MKKIFFILLLLILITGGALAFFIATFDANKYKPEVEKRLTEMIGNTVTLGDIDLAFKGGISLVVKDLAIFKEGDLKPALEVHETSSSLKLLPLLNRNIEIGSVTVIDPTVKVIRKANGEIQVFGINLKKALDKTSDVDQTNKAEAQVAALSFLINSITVEDGEISFRDESMAPPLNLDLHRLNLKLDNVSLIRPTDVKASVGILSKSPNVEFTGRIYPPQPNRVGSLKKASLKLDLNSILIQDIVRAYPPAREFNLEKIGGKLSLEVDELPFDETAATTLEASLEFTEGSFKSSQIPASLEDIKLRATFGQGNLDVLKFSTLFGNGKIDASGKIFDVTKDPRANIRTTIENLSLKEIIPTSAAGNPSIEGKLNLKFEGQLQGKDWPSISRTLTGGGNLSLAEGKITNLNILREALTRISIVPGLMERLEARLPESYKEKITSKDTPLNPVNLPFQVADGVIGIRPLRLGTDLFEFNSESARIGLSGEVATKGILVLDSHLSSAMISSVNELKYITNNSGQLEIPIGIQGKSPRILVLPDLQHVASKLTLTKAQDLIGDLLGKKLGRETPTTQAPTAQSGTTSAESTTASTQASSSGEQSATQSPQLTSDDPMENLLGNLLGKALKEMK